MLLKTSRGVGSSRLSLPDIPTVDVCDNKLVCGWSRDRENDDNMEDVRIFRQVRTFRRIITPRHVSLYCFGQLMLWLSLSSTGYSIPPFISKEGEVKRKVTKSVTT
jgi:hypothetical protein